MALMVGMKKKPFPASKIQPHSSSPSPSRLHTHVQTCHLVAQLARSSHIRRLPTSIAIATLLMFFIYTVYSKWETIGYTFRPLWDTPPKPFVHLTHYHAENVPMAHLCSLHGWTIRNYPRHVYDAIIFNNELDLLELRWRELDNVVTKFILLESNTTFTGQGKPLWFNENRERFAFAGSKIIYAKMGGRECKRKEDPFVLEHAQRVQMDMVLQKYGIEEGDLLIMADADEIPSAHTINLLRWCDGYPEIMHLQMSSYLYSFEFFVDKGTWRPTVHIYQPGFTKYDHGRQADILLADAGWHCSFCLRHVRDVVFKMQAYSHADRVRSQQFLDLYRVQAMLCKGTDLFDMLPEAYTFKDLVAMMGAVPRSYSVVNFPSFLLNNHERFRFLLPGNCLREKELN